MNSRATLKKALFLGLLTIPVFLSAQRGSVEETGRTLKTVSLTGIKYNRQPFFFTTEYALLSDLTIGYAWKKFELTLGIENIFNVEWNEGRLSDSEVYFNPAAPRSFKGQIILRF